MRFTSETDSKASATEIIEAGEAALAVSGEMTIEREAEVYVAFNEFKKIIEGRLKAIGTHLKERMESYGARTVDFSNARLAMTPASPPAPCVTVDAAALLEAAGEARADELVGLGVLRREVRYMVDEGRLAAMASEGRIPAEWAEAAVRRGTTPGTQARLTATARGDLKARLKDLRGRLLPAGSGEEQG